MSSKLEDAVTEQREELQQGITCFPPLVILNKSLVGIDCYDLEIAAGWPNESSRNVWPQGYRKIVESPVGEERANRESINGQYLEGETSDAKRTDIKIEKTFEAGMSFVIHGKRVGAPFPGEVSTEPHVDAAGNTEAIHEIGSDAL
jgi:hypothetical protein